MRGVVQSMVLGVSTVALLACQGCQAGQASAYGVNAQQYNAGREVVMTPAASARPLPDSSMGAAPQHSIVSSEQGVVLQADPSFSLTQGQTTTSPSISITPVLGLDTGSTSLNMTPDFSGLRMSNANAVVDFEGARKSATFQAPVRSVREFDASISFSAPDAHTGFGFDVGVVPRLSVRSDGEFRTQRFGGEIRIGQNFDQRGEDVDAKSWYLFAGADGEALIYEPYSERNWTNSIAMRDQVTVGDMQAGVSFTQGGGQVSFSYIRREVSYSERGVSGSENEDFMGVSFTLRR